MITYTVQFYYLYVLYPSGRNLMTPEIAFISNTKGENAIVVEL